MERLPRQPWRSGLRVLTDWLGAKGDRNYHAALGPDSQIKSEAPRRLSLTDGRDWSAPASSGVTVSEASVLALSAAWACVNLLAGTIASLPLVVYRTNGAGRREVASGHYLYRILHDSPNYDQTAMDFWEGGVAALELRGNMHARLERFGGRLVALHPIYAPSVSRQPDGSLRYRWTENGKTWDEPQENVLHIRGFGGSPLGGLSTLGHGREVFGTSQAVNTTAAAMFANGLRSSAAISFKDWLTKDQRDPFEAALSEKFVGAHNAGRPIVLEGGAELKTLSFSPEDAQMLESRAFSVEEVCRIFGVPPHMIGHTEKSTSWGTGLEQQTLAFQKFTLRKRLKRIEQALEKQLLTPSDRVAGVTIEFNLEGLLRGDSVARAAFYESGLRNGWTTINEVRSLENLPPVEGGDVPRTQMQNVPINMAQLPQLVTGGPS